ncbi:MAG: BatA domain-containing protein [Cytophagaceae bacterium]
MNFLYPQVLFGLAAVSIPIIIHLFNFQRPKKIRFSNISLLKNVKEVNSNRLKIKHWLILLSRVSFISFLVLAFAQPFIESENAGMLQNATNASVYIDNSFSMENELNEEKSFDVAVKSSYKLTDVLGANVSYNLLTNDFEGRDQFGRNKEKLLERLSEIKYSPLFRDFSSVVKRLNPKEGSNVFIFSDFQKSTIGNIGDFMPDSTINYFLVPIQNKTTSNIFIDSLWLNSPFVKVGENNELTVQFHNEGKEEAKNVFIKLMLDDVQVSTAEISIPSRSTAKHTFVFNINDHKSRKGRITIEDQPITFDNDYYFVFDASPKIKVMHIYNEASKYVPAVFGNERLFETSSSHTGQINYALINSMHVVVLDGLKEIPASLASTLKEFSNKGGSIVIFPTDKTQAESYSGLFKSLSLPPVNTIISDSSAGRINFELLPPDISNPFFQNVFEKSDYKMDMPYAYPVWQWSGRGNVLLKTRSDKSFLSAFQPSFGKIYLFSTPLKNTHTNFFRHSIFVPVMYKIAFNSIKESERLSYSFQDRIISFDVGEQTKNSVFNLSSEGASIIPAQRLIGDNLSIEIPVEELYSGIYKVSNSSDFEKYFALNYGKKESLMDFYTPEELQTIFAGHGNVQIYDVSGSDQFIDSFKKANIGTPLWKYFIILCLGFLLMEILLIRFL